jgi:hypothetical protein
MVWVVLHVGWLTSSIRATGAFLLARATTATATIITTLAIGAVSETWWRRRRYRRRRWRYDGRT